jgi:acetoacetate decarboxylase
MEQATRKGKLTRDKFGASMPVDAPYYQSPPFYYRDARSLTVTFETDPDAAAELLPEGLELPVPSHAAVMVIYYPTSTFGSYSEAVLGVPCRWQGEDQLYVAHIVVDTVPPLVGGREIWGYPKKIAGIELSEEDEFVRGTVERPTGVRLVSVTMRPERPLPPAGDDRLSVVSLRVIPSVEANQPPAVAELIQAVYTDRRVHEAWTGPATLQFDAKSAFDPWHVLPIRQVLLGAYSRFDFTLPHGRVLRRY